MILDADKKIAENTKRAVRQASQFEGAEESRIGAAKEKGGKMNNNSKAFLAYESSIQRFHKLSETIR